MQLIIHLYLNTKYIENVTFIRSHNVSITQMNNAQDISENIGEDIPIYSDSTAGCVVVSWWEEMI